MRQPDQRAWIWVQRIAFVGALRTDILTVYQQDRRAGDSGVDKLEVLWRYLGRFSNVRTALPPDCEYRFALGRIIRQRADNLPVRYKQADDLRWLGAAAQHGAKKFALIASRTPLRAANCEIVFEVVITGPICPVVSTLTPGARRSTRTTLARLTVA